MKLFEMLVGGGVIVATAALCGCGGSSQDNSSSGAGETSGSAKATTKSLDAGKSTASDASASSSEWSADAAANTGDADPQADPETDDTQTKTIEMAPFDVPPNQEVFYCQTFANPWKKAVDIKTYNLNMDRGSHHMFAFYQTNATDAATSKPCPSGGLTFGAFTFSSQSPMAVLTFPATVGAAIPAGTGFNVMAHYVNTTTSKLTAHLKLTMYVAKDGVVTNHAGMMFLNNLEIAVPSTGQPVVSSSSLTLNQDVKVILASSHMHKFATNFVSSATLPDGTTKPIYSTTQWDEPKAAWFSTPLEFPSGTTINWSCTDVNNTGKELTFGEYANTNVMCISVNIFYPVTDITKPVIGTGVGGL